MAQWYVVNIPGGELAGDTVASAPLPGNVTVVSGPYSTQALAQAALNSSGSAKSSIKPVAPLPQLNVSNPLTGLAAIGDFFGRIGEASTWIRVGEVVLGLILVAVGVARITHAVPIATSVAKKVGMVAAA